MLNLEQLGQNAVKAKIKLATLTTEEKNKALCHIAESLEKYSATIIEANKMDCKNGKEKGMSAAFLDRLSLNEDRIHSFAEGMRAVATLPDPVGRILEEITRPNGLFLQKIAVPIGVIGIIFEARPNVTADAFALCFKSGNAVILRGGSDAINSNTAICNVMRDALSELSLPADAVQLVEDTSHESAKELMRLKKYVDLIIPRGGKRLIQSVVENATVPVIETGAGTCHIYVDKDANLDMATDIVFWAKTSRPSVCNAAECLLVHKDIAQIALPKVAAKLQEKSVELRCDEASYKILSAQNSQENLARATDDDWGKEYNDYILAVKVVHTMDEAIDHVRNFGTGHSECIVTDNKATAEEFLTQVDAAAVYHNASTRFTDGGEFGMGAEIGISTQKLHARGPLGLRELTSMKYKVYGKGQLR